MDDMEDALLCVYNKKTGMFEEYQEPFAVVEYPTEKEFEFMKAAIEHYKRRGKWENREGYDNWNCSECDYEVVGYDENPAEYGVNYCEKCGAWMNWEQKTEPQAEAVEESNFFMERFMKQE